MSFSDMMQSGRGPGVIGMLLALVVLVGFGLLFMFAFDEGFQGGGQTIESVIASQAKEIENFHGGITRGTETLDLVPARIAKAKELKRAKLESETLVQKIASLKSRIEAGKADIVAKNAEWETYKNEYREFIRGKAKGQVLEKLETRNGEVYVNVSIRDVSAIGIQIRHDEGHKRIPFEDLTDEMQDFYQFDPSQKQDAMAAESAVRDQHDAAVAVARGQEDEKMALQREQDDAAAKEKINAEILEKQAQITAATSEIRNLENEKARAQAEADMARAAGKMHLNKSGRVQSKIRFQQNRINTLNGEIARLRSRL